MTATLARRARARFYPRRMSGADDVAPVVVVGGGLAGLAAAARLAKAGRPVVLYERGDALGATWAPAALGPDGRLVDDAGSVLGFPAPWRDLFRKSGRPLEAELARSGYALVGAGPPRVVFADGSDLVLPTDRGGQYEVLRRAYGPAPAGRWRDLLDGLDEMWQTLRSCGLEAERDPAALTGPTRRRLWHRHRVADLAERVDHPHLRALVRSVAYRQGTTPERAPALTAMELALSRRFGRWQVEPQGVDGGDTGRSSVLTQALVGRLALRRVEVSIRTGVSGIEGGRGDDLLVHHAGGVRPASAVVLTVDPWEAARLASRVSGGMALSLRGARPALTPHVSHRSGEGSAPLGETVELDADGVPVLTYRWRSGEAGVASTHDYRRPTRRPAYGLDVRGFRGWLRRPGPRTGVADLYYAGPSCPAGPGAPQVLLSAALAAYAIVGHPV